MPGDPCQRAPWFRKPERRAQIQLSVLPSLLLETAKETMTSNLSARSSRGFRLAAAPAVLAAITLVTCACTTQSGSATPQATVTVTAHPTHVVTAPTSGPHVVTTGTSGQAPASAAPVAAAASGSAAPAAPPPPAPCLTRYLNASVGISQGTPGSTYVVLVFKNLDNTSCTLYGYPGVAMDDGVPVTPVGLASVEDPATPRELVTLGPYGTASALLRIMSVGDYSPAACNPVTTQWLQVIPPNQSVPIYVGYTSQTCAKPVQIHTVDAVRPGTGSSSG